MLMLTMLAGAAYFVCAVEMDGRTLWDRIWAHISMEDQKPAAKKKKKRPSRPSPKRPPSGKSDKLGPATDLHTEEDRDGLDRLIESKLDRIPKDET
jgi:hypothetical protein